MMWKNILERSSLQKTIMRCVFHAG